jgi:hypothetical protein
MEKTGTNAATASCVADATQVSHRSLADLERVIHEGELAYVEVGRALQEIKKGKLYKEKYNTFEEYCEKRWGFSRQTAYEYMDAAAVAANVSSNLRNRPSKTQALVLKALDPDQQKEVEADTDFPNTTVKELKEKIAKVRGVPKGGGSSSGSGVGKTHQKLWSNGSTSRSDKSPCNLMGTTQPSSRNTHGSTPPSERISKVQSLIIYQAIAAICAKKLGKAK